MFSVSLRDTNSPPALRRSLWLCSSPPALQQLLTHISTDSWDLNYTPPDEQVDEQNAGVDEEMDVLEHDIVLYCAIFPCVQTASTEIIVYS
jgi:hypothetical protein